MDSEQQKQKDPDLAGIVTPVSAPGPSSAASKTDSPAGPATTLTTVLATALAASPATGPAPAPEIGQATTPATTPATGQATAAATAQATIPATTPATNQETASGAGQATAPGTDQATSSGATPATGPTIAPATSSATKLATASATAQTTTPTTTPVTTTGPGTRRARKLERAPRAQSSTAGSEPKPPEATRPAPAPAAPANIPRPRPPRSSLPPSAAKPPEPTPAKGPEASPSLNVRPHPPGTRSPISMRAASVPQPPPSGPVPAHLSPHPQRAFSVAGTADTQPQTVEDFRVHLTTWNVGSAVPPDDVTSLLGLNTRDWDADMYIIGLQEVNSMINKRLKDVLFTDQWSDLCMETLSPIGYVLVTSERMQGVLLLVFAKYYHLPFLRGVQTETTRTGLGGYWGNKGGVSARMTVFGHSLCFLNCHLPAHMENSDQRVEDFDSILQQQQFEGQAAMGVLGHDLVFWFGDLNFRIEDYEMHFVKGAIDSNKLSLLWEKDQLNMAKDSESVLEGFHEGPLKFPPTYKFDVGTNTYDTSGKKRKPAWTDRILWRLRPAAPPGPVNSTTLRRSPTTGLTSGTKVTQDFYRSHMEYTVSDHKPVTSLFTLQFPYKVDNPLVTIIVEDEWVQVSDARCKFKMTTSYSRSSWDWIGLYKVGFKHHKDYASYVWAKQEESDYLTQEYQVTFPEEDLPKGSGDYILGYYSNNMSTIVGVTEPFQIQLPSSSPEASSSPSDSSDSSPEEDSKAALLRPKSRSPSPGKSKTRRSRSRTRSRSRSPALSKLQGLCLKSRSPSPRPPAGRRHGGGSPDGLLSPASSPGASAVGALVTAISGEQLSAQAAPPAGESKEAGSS